MTLDMSNLTTELQMEEVRVYMTRASLIKCVIVHLDYFKYVYACCLSEGRFLSENFLNLVFILCSL